MRDGLFRVSGWQVGLSLLSVFFLTALTGCSTYEAKATHPEEEKAVKAAATAPRPDAKRIRVLRVENRTSNPKYDALALYVQLEAARVLEKSGRYSVVNSEEMARAAAKLGLKVVPDAAVESELKVELLEVKETSGGTLSLGIISAQGRGARVRVGATITDLAGGPATTTTGESHCSKGAWGVLATVDRERMLEGAGYWELDKDMLGIAAAGALKKALDGVAGPRAGARP